MTDNQSLSTMPEPSPTPTKGKSGVLKGILLLLLALIIAAGVLGSAFWLQKHDYHVAPASADTAVVEQQMTVVDRKFQALDARVDALSARVDEIASSPVASADNSKTSSADLAHMQNDMAALNVAVGKLKDEVKLAANGATAIRGEIVAYLQLREAADSGHGFAHELNALQGTVKGDSGFEDLLDKLTPFAEKGAPTMAALREKLADNIASADQAITKAEAQTWWERILAELKGLVSIRPLHGGGAANEGLQTMQAALARDDIDAALDEMKNLPPEAQTALEDWKQQAEARHTIDDALQTIANRLAANTAPAAQDEP